MKINAKILVAALAASAVAAAEAQSVRRGVVNGRTRRAAAAAAAEEETNAAAEGRVVLEQFPKTGRASTLAAPSLQGATLIGSCYTKPRRWIVTEAISYRSELEILHQQ